MRIVYAASKIVSIDLTFPSFTYFWNLQVIEKSSENREPLRMVMKCYDRGSVSISTTFYFVSICMH